MNILLLYRLSRGSTHPYLSPHFSSLLFLLLPLQSLQLPLLSLQLSLAFLLPPSLLLTPALLFNPLLLQQLCKQLAGLSTSLKLGGISCDNKYCMLK